MPRPVYMADLATAEWRPDVVSVEGELGGKRTTLHLCIPQYDVDEEWIKTNVLPEWWDIYREACKLPVRPKGDDNADR